MPNFENTWVNTFFDGLPLELSVNQRIGSPLILTVSGRSPGRPSSKLSNPCFWKYSSQFFFVGKSDRNGFAWIRNGSAKPLSFMVFPVSSNVNFRITFTDNSSPSKCIISREELVTRSDTNSSGLLACLIFSITSQLDMVTPNDLISGISTVSDILASGIR